MIALALVLAALASSTHAQPAVTLAPQLGLVNYTGQGAFSPDGRRLACTDWCGDVVVWDAETGQELHRLPASAGYCWPYPEIHFSPDSARLACARESGVGVWDVESGRRIRGFEGWVWQHDPVLSPNWAHLALGDEVGGVTVFDVETGEQLHHLNAHAGDVMALHFASEGSLLSVGADKMACLWEVETGTRQRMIDLSVHETKLQRVTYNRAAGLLLTTSTGPDLALVHDLASGEELLRFDHEPGAEHRALGVRRSYRLSPNGRWVLERVGGLGGAVASVWEVRAGRKVRLPRGLRVPAMLSTVAHTWTVAPTLFSPDDRWLIASRDGSKQVIVLDPATGAEVRGLDGDPQSAYPVCFTPDGQYLVTKTAAAGLALWDAETWERMRSLPWNRVRNRQPLFSADGRRVVGKAEGAHLALWDMESDSVVMELSGRCGGWDQLRFDSEGLVVASVQEAVVWDLEELAPSARFRSARLDGNNPLRIRQARYSPIDGRLTFLGATRERPVLWDAETGEQVVGFDAPPLRPSGLAWSEDGLSLAGGCHMKGLCIWDAETGKLLHTTEVRKTTPERVAFSPDGAVVASWGQVRAVCFWDVATGELISQSPAGESGVTELVFSPSGEAVASVDRSGSARLWEAPAAGTPRLFETASAGLECAAFSPDGRLFAAGDTDGVITLWDVASGRIAGRLEGHNDRLRAIDFAPGGRLLASVGADDMVKLWDVRQGQLLVTLWAISDPAISLEDEGAPPSRLLDDHDWLAWTPEGYYACSERAEQFIRFRDDAGKLHGAAEYSDDLRSPDRVRAQVANALAGESVP